MIEAAAYLIAIAGAEIVVIYSPPIWGVMAYILVLSIIVVRSAVVDRLYQQKLLLALTLVPLLRIASLSVSVLDLPSTWHYITVYALLLVAAVLAARILKYSPGGLGLDFNSPGWQLAVTATGPLVALIGYTVLEPEAMAASLSWREAWLPALLLLGIAFIEELVFRGIIQRGAVNALGRRGIIYVSLLYAIMYIGFVPLTWLAFAFLISLYFGWVVNETDSIMGAALAHGICNIALYLIFPFIIPISQPF